MKRRIALIMLAWLALGLSFSCEPSEAEERQAIVSLLDVRQKAMELGDAKAYEGLIGTRYKDAWGDRERVLSEIRAMFKDSPGVTLSYSHRKILIQGRNARVLQDYVMMVTEPELRLEGTDNLVLAKEDGTWRIVSGLFQKERMADDTPEEPAP